MAMLKLIKPLIQKNDTKILLIVLDGIGGLPVNGKTELEAANIPNLNSLARESACGLHIPVSHGITPGSGPGHLGLFGYDPIEHQMGRGVLEALGLGLEVRKTDVAVRCNYATFKNGIIVDRRAGRIPTEKNKDLTERLQIKINKIGRVQVIFSAGVEHRFAVLFRFPTPLKPDSAMITDTDPQKDGMKPLIPRPLSKKAAGASNVAEKLLVLAKDILKKEEKANYILMRGFSSMPPMPEFEESFGLKSLAIATYPMYRGLARLVGMDTPMIEGEVKDEIGFLEKKYNSYDFFFLHIKKIDSYGEDGNFEGKVREIEKFDRLLPDILNLKPDVLILTGDHSTPSLLRSHSWHPVPVLIKSPYVLGGLCSTFTERECTKGELGMFPTVNLMPLALAHSLRLKKFGA